MEIKVKTVAMNEVQAMLSHNMVSWPLEKQNVSLTLLCLLSLITGYNQERIF